MRVIPTPTSARAAAPATREGLAAVPGVTRVAMVSSLPILGDLGPVCHRPIDDAVAVAPDERDADGGR